MPLSHTVLTSLLCLFLMVPVMTDTAAAGDKRQNMGQVKPSDKKLDKKTEERGRYIIKIAGCKIFLRIEFRSRQGQLPSLMNLVFDKII